MKALWPAACGLLIAGCESMNTTAHRQDPQSGANPALLRCSAGKAPVCSAYGGRTYKRFYDCACKSPGIGAT